MPAQNQVEADTLAQFRKEVYEEGIIAEGDTLGTDDETFMWVVWKADLPFINLTTELGLPDSRFLRARKFNVKLAKKMLQDCQQWRKTVEGVGIDELYRRIDPFDVGV